MDEQNTNVATIENPAETNGHVEEQAAAPTPPPKKAPVPRKAPTPVKKPTAAPKPATSPKPAKIPAPAEGKAAAGGKAKAPKAQTPKAVMTMDERDQKQAEKQIRWTPIKLALLDALKKAGANNAAAAALPADVAKASKGKLTEDVVRRQSNNHFDLMIQGFIRKADTAEGGKGIYLTAKGLKVDTAPPAKGEKAKAGK